MKCKYIWGIYITMGRSEGRTQWEGFPNIPDYPSIDMRRHWWFWKKNKRNLNKDKLPAVSQGYARHLLSFLQQLHPTECLHVFVSKKEQALYGSFRRASPFEEHL